MLTIGKLAQNLNLQQLTEYGGTDTPVTGCYIGDLLSWVMSRAQPGDAWLTIMGNVNAVAVASLTDAACIVLCENAPLDEDALRKANQHGITVYSSEKNSYALAIDIAQLLGNSDESKV